MEFNVDPYYDDFEQNAKDNNYMRIMFKPGRAVQARELTQIQSILQNQIKQFGDHIFQDGSPVIGGNLTLDNKVKYLKLLETYNNQDIEVTSFLGTIIRNSAGTIQAKVLATYFPVDGIPTLMVKYLTGNEFGDGDIIRIINSTTEAQLIASNATGTGTVVSINEGVFYVDGYFVQVNDQTAVASAYGTAANVKIGLEISEDIVDSEVDATLLDPAQGSFNYQAPGADRYQFNLTLSTRPLDTQVDESKFFELMRLENGSITKQVKYPVYAELEKTLARRTFDESGDYTVLPFRASIFDSSNANNYIIAIEPGKAYVKGFEFETLATLKLEADKPRSASDIKALNDADVDISYGNYIYVTSIRGTSNGFINIAALETVDIHLAQTNNVTATGTHSGTANAFFYANTRIGTARVRNFIRHTADVFTANTDANGVYKVYLTDINIEPLTVKVNIASSNANTLRFNDKMSPNTNVYSNVTVTVLPVRLDAVPNVNTANVFINSYRLNANSSVANVFNSNVNVGSVIYVGNMVRQVVSVNTSGDYLTVNTAWDRTIQATDKDSNPLEVFIQNPYTQNVTSQTRTIERYDGPTRTVFLDAPFNNNGVADGNTVVSFNYHFDHAESLVAGPAVGNSVAKVANASMNVALNSKYLGGETAVEERIKNALIFKLPGNYIKRSSINNADYNSTKFLPNRSNNGTGGVFAISQGSGLESYETIPWADSTSSVQDNLIVIVRDNNGNTYFPNGTIIQLTSSNVEIGNPATSLTVNTNVPDIIKADLIVNVKQNDAEDSIRIKNYISNTSFTATSSSFTYPTAVNGNTTVTLPSYTTVANINVSHGLIFLTDTTYNSVRPGDSINLFVPDVVNIRKVLKGNTTHLPDANNFSDITDHFYADFGQRDDMYDHAKLVLKEGYNVANAKILVHVDFYQHVYNSTNTSFFSIDSYPQSQYESGIIPIYVSQNAQFFNLRDCLDFRPTRQLGSATGAFQNPNIPSPDEVTELSLEYYLPRIDKLVLSKDKEFRIVKGRSSPQPVAPADLDDAMTLYTIALPPYVANINEIKLRYKDNKRYTMKDIASIDKRLQKVEFFTSLNNVENLALSDPTEYEDGTKKEKYGVVGENFRNFNIADFRSVDFRVSLNNGFMLPAVASYPVGLQNIGNSSTKLNKRTISLNYTETPAITQGVCSDKVVSVQPFLFGQFNGVVSLVPESDYWVNEQLKPDIISVPERIIEHHHFTREVVREPAPPVTIQNIVQTTNVVNQYITVPGTNPPPPPPPPTQVVVQLPPPPPVIIYVPQPPPPIPPEEPWFPPYVPPPCPAPWMRITLADGTEITAGELKVGMFVKTMHEHTLEWGNHEVTHVESIQDIERVEIEFDHVNFVCSKDHKFYVNGEWIEVYKLKAGDIVYSQPETYEIKSIKSYATGEVIKITVNEAHTYICEGLLSHNKMPSFPPPEIQPPPPPPAPPPTVSIPDPPPPVICPPLDPPIIWNPPPVVEFPPPVPPPPAPYNPSVPDPPPPEPYFPEPPAPPPEPTPVEPRLPPPYKPVVEIPWILPPITPITFGGFDGTNFYPIYQPPFDAPPTPPMELWTVPPNIPIFTQPITLGPAPVDEIVYEQPVISVSDVARDDNFGEDAGGGRGDLEFGIFQYDLN
jgi:hypothetical protein